MTPVFQHVRDATSTSVGITPPEWPAGSTEPPPKVVAHYDHASPGSVEVVPLYQSAIEPRK